MELRARVKGCLYAGALGDCIGGYFENCMSAKISFLDIEWQLSDDTQLTLATCESIIRRKSISAENIASQFLLWYNQNRLTGLGSSTLGAMKALQVGGHWALAGRQGEYAAGNGAAMRIAPIAFLQADRQEIADVCRITHKNDEAYVGALAVVKSIRSAIDQSWIDGKKLIPFLLDSLPDTQVRERLLLLNNETSSISAVGKRYGNSGFVADTVPLAIYAAQQTSTYSLPQIFEEIIESGGDTDTICAIAGNISGAFLGFEKLPAEYLLKLRSIKNYALLERIIEEFCDFVISRPTLSL